MLASHIATGNPVENKEPFLHLEGRKTESLMLTKWMSHPDKLENQQAN